MAHRFPACALLVAAAFGAVLYERPARADDPAATDNVSKARALFAEARKFAELGNYEQACGKFEDSLRLNLGIGTQFNLADCWEHIGRTASARALFLGTAASAHAAGQAEREQVAKARADALEPRLLRLLIDVRSTDAELSIRRNQVSVKRDDWGTAVPVDPGTYSIEASAPGKKTWSARVSLPANASEAVSVTIPSLEDAAASREPRAEPSGESSSAKSATHSEAVNSAPPLTEPAGKSSRRTAYAVSLTGLGVVGIGLGMALALEYQSKNNDAKATCPSGVGCSAFEVDHHAGLVSDAKTFRAWSFVGFGVGGAALVGAAVLYLTPSSSQRASNFVASPFFTADGSWGAAASGRF